VAPSIFWFRRDLRLSDHPALLEAVRLGGADGVLPLFVVDDEFLAPSGPTRARFLAGCLEALEDSMGAPLVMRHGDPAKVVTDLVREVGASDVVVTGDYGPVGQRRDGAVATALEAQGVRFHQVSSPYAVEPGTVSGDKGQPLKVFSAFRRRWEVLGPHVVSPAPDVRWISASSDITASQIEARSGKRRPALFGDLPDGPPVNLPVPGEGAAHQLLEDFMGGPADGYKVRRDFLAENATSGLSPYLRFGCIHPRTILHVASGPGKDLEHFRSEVCWREFYADVLFHNPQSVTEPLQAQMSELVWDKGPEAEERFRRWARGETGIPLVDASMRQLLAEGLMHNRARMIAASFLVKHLHLDWRWGARWFMWRLVDGDLASNVHGWQWTAGTGTDAAPFYRIFSPLAQAERFDPDAAFIHRYVPELAGIPAPKVFEPGGGVSLLDQADYPEAMIDLKAEREEALRRLDEAKQRYGATTQ